MTFPHGTTVTVLRDSPGGFDAYGDPITSTTAETNIPNCAVAPRFSTEPTERGRQGVIVGLTVYAPFGSDVLFTDRLEIAGVEYVIEGTPGSWSNPFTGSTPGMEIAVKRAVG